MGKSRKDMCPFSYWSVVNDIKVQKQKDICMAKTQKDMCPFSYWRAREVNINSECNGKFHQSPETKKSGLKIRYLACTDLVINILQLISVHII